MILLTNILLSSTNNERVILSTSMDTQNTLPPAGERHEYGDAFVVSSCRRMSETS